MTPTPTTGAPTLERRLMEEIATGRCPDLGNVLGLQPDPAGKGLVLRAFLPRAGSVEAVSPQGRKIAALSRVHDDGLFEARLPRRKNRFPYRWRIDGGEIREDPYRFPGLVNDDDAYLFNEGTHEHCYRWLGAHAVTLDGVQGVGFAVWAPCARRISVVGDFNGWDGRCHVMRKHRDSGIREIFIPGIEHGALYKYEIIDARGRRLPLKADPCARSMQHPPETASRVLLDGSYEWGDGDWMRERRARDHYERPMCIYEVHAASWRRREREGNRYLSYHELGDELLPYVIDLGFTHIQLMPLSEYPFDGSWGYQPIGLFAPTIRHGTPDELRAFIDRCHQHGIGVFLDWVPGHFPADEHGLGRFDGTCLYEHADPRQGRHPDWQTLIYNYGRKQVQSFLLSNANYWLEEFHLDGLRVDAVASMLYLDYSREEGEWIPNRFGGRENLDAIELLRMINTRVYRNHPGIVMIAEESTSWPGVSAPVDQGGLGFGFKWNMGWMNDSLRYIARNTVHRRYHDNELTFGIMYAWAENFILPLSHDEVVHGKGSLVGKMPGDDWQAFANLRAYLGYMWAYPGKKLLFMGGEFAQVAEWNHDRGLDWHLLERDRHRGVQNLLRDLNRLCRESPALHQLDRFPEGFQWLQMSPAGNSVFAWLRRGHDAENFIVAVCNLTPQTHFEYRLGVPSAGIYRERFNSDASEYGGSGQGNLGSVEAVDTGRDEQPFSIVVTLPPLAMLLLEIDPPAED